MPPPSPLAPGATQNAVVSARHIYSSSTRRQLLLVEAESTPSRHPTGRGRRASTTEAAVEAAVLSEMQTLGATLEPGASATFEASDVVATEDASYSGAAGEQAFDVVVTVRDGVFTIA